MRNIIKKVLREFALKEAEESSHASCRYIQRVRSKPSYTTTNVPQKIGESNVEKARYIIELIKKIDFPSSAEFFIPIAFSNNSDFSEPKNFFSAKGFYYEDPNDNCSKYEKYSSSWGNQISMIVEDNTIITILMHKNSKKPKSRKNGGELKEVNVDVLKNNLKKYKNIDIPNTIEGIRSMKQINIKNEREYYEIVSKKTRQKQTPQLPSNKLEIIINDIKYVIDKDDKTFYQKNKLKEKQKIQDYINKLLDADEIDEKQSNMLNTLIEYV